MLNASFLKRCEIAVHFLQTSKRCCLVSSSQNILLNFKLKNEASRAYLNKNKRIFKWRPFWNKVYWVVLIHYKGKDCIKEIFAGK